MPNLVFGAIGTFILSLILACWLLRWRCRGIGRAFGPRARLWAILIVVSMATVSAGVGLLLEVASHQAQAAFAAVVVPGRLWFSRLPPEDDRLSSGRKYRSGLLTILFGRLYVRMGDDMQAWTDIRLRAASPEPKWIADAVTYYANQVRGRIKDDRACDELDRRQQSIICSIEIMRLINLDTTQARLRERLQAHPSLAVRNYPDDDLRLLARRLESDALGELRQFLDRIYQLGHYKQLIYPMRPSAHRFPKQYA
jgi:hypothetical protein